MDFGDMLEEFCLTEVDDQNTSPDGISVGEKGLSTSRDDETIEVSPHWMEAQEDPFGTDDFLEESEPTETTLPNSYYLHLEEGELYNQIRQKFNEIRSQILLSEGEISTVSFRQLREDKERFYTAEDADFGVMAMVDIHRDPSPKVQEIREHVCEEVRHLDEDVTSDQIVSVEASYSDFDVCELISVRGNIVTPHPYRYYSDVESVSEYVEVLADDEEEKEELLEQNVYKVFYRLDDVEDEPPEETRVLCEGYMESQMEQITTIEGEHTFEGECVILKDYDGYEEFKEETDILGYQAPDGKETLSFWVRLPIDDWEVE